MVSLRSVLNDTPWNVIRGSIMAGKKTCKLLPKSLLILCTSIFLGLRANGIVMLDFTRATEKFCRTVGLDSVKKNIESSY